MLDRTPTDSGKATMTADSESVTKHAPLLPVHLNERMKVGRLVEVARTTAVQLTRKVGS